MKPQFAVRKQINDFVEMVAKSPVKGFYPTAVAKYANISEELAFKYLIDLTQTGELFLKWELRCPDFTCGNLIEITNSLRSNDEIMCGKCGIEFDLQETDFYPRFDINLDFKDFIRKDIKKKQVLTLRSH